MEKITTIFNRNWEGNHKATSEILKQIPPEATATEKLDGTNVRVTIRNHSVVRLEKRRNPSPIEKAKGIKEPWYIDADEYSPQDKWIYDVLNNTNLTAIEDGEWGGEAVGTNIQGNPLNLSTNRIVFFSLGQCPIFENVPTNYEGLKEWLPKQISKYGEGKIEGIVWWLNGEPIGKIKLKDF